MKKLFITACFLVFALAASLTPSLLTTKDNTGFQARAQALLPDRPYLTGWYSYVNRPEVLTDLAADGSSIILMYGGDSSTEVVNNYLNKAQEQGIKVIVGLNNLTDDQQATPEAIAQKANQHKNHPALYGWYISDEPHYQGTGASYLEAVYNAIKNVDPNHIITQVHYGQPYDEYVNSMDVLMVDWYPGWESSLSEEFNWMVRRSYPVWLNGVEWAKSHDKQGFIAVPQGFGEPYGPGRNLTDAEYRYHVFSAVVLDTDAIIFYKETWPNSEVKTTIEQIINQIQSIGAEMNQGTTNDSQITVSEPPDRLVYRYGVNGNRHVILAVNIANHDVSDSGAQLTGVRFTLPVGVRPSQVEVLDENRTIPVTNGTFADNFSRFEVHAYAFEAGGGTPFPTPTPSPTPTLTPIPTSTPTFTPTPPPSPSPSEIIIDNIDARFSTSSSQDAWEVYPRAGGEHYGDSHHVNRYIGTGQDTATWSFTVPKPGNYDVYAWWWEGDWRPSDVPYTINYHNGAKTAKANQKVNGGQWNLLGTFYLQDEGSVVVSDDVSAGLGIVADAIRLVYRSEGPSVQTQIFLPLVSKSSLP